MTKQLYLLLRFLEFAGTGHRDSIVRAQSKELKCYLLISSKKYECIRSSKTWKETIKFKSQRRDHQALSLAAQPGRLLRIIVDKRNEEIGAQVCTSARLSVPVLAEVDRN